MALDFSLIKEHPIATGGIVIGGGLILYLIYSASSGGSGSTVSSVVSSTPATDPNALAANAAITQAQLAAQVQNNANNAQASVQLAQTQAQLQAVQIAATVPITQSNNDLAATQNTNSAAVQVAQDQSSAQLGVAQAQAAAAIGVANTQAAAQLAGLVSTNNANVSIAGINVGGAITIDQSNNTAAVAMNAANNNAAVTINGQNTGVQTANISAQQNVSLAQIQGQLGLAAIAAGLFGPTAAPKTTVNPTQTGNNTPVLNPANPVTPISTGAGIPLGPTQGSGLSTYTPSANTNGQVFVPGVTTQSQTPNFIQPPSGGCAPYDQACFAQLQATEQANIGIQANAVNGYNNAVALNNLALNNQQRAGLGLPPLTLATLGANS